LPHNSPRKLAITFDDGPNPALTHSCSICLDTLRRAANSFVDWEDTRECPELVKETGAARHSGPEIYADTSNLFGCTVDHSR